MAYLIEDLITQFSPSMITLAITGVGFGALLVVFGLSGVFAGRDPALERMARQGARGFSRTADRGILRPTSADPTGILKTLIPSSRAERTEVQRQLAQAGLSGPHAVRNYYLVRLLLGLMLRFRVAKPLEITFRSDFIFDIGYQFKNGQDAFYGLGGLFGPGLAIKIVGNFGINLEVTAEVGKWLGIDDYLPPTTTRQPTSQRSTSRARSTGACV